jgi:hypothetical protein
MFYRCLAVVCALFVMVGSLRAEDFAGKISKVDTANSSILIKDKDDKPRSFKVMDGTKLLDADGKELKDGIKSEMLKEGVEISVKAEGKGKKMKVNEVKITSK